MKRRSGFTLVEVVMAMTVGFILLGCGVRMLVLVMRLDRAARTRVNDDVTLDRLARQFRGDVALATAPPTNAGMERGRLDLTHTSDTTVRYQFQNEALVRTELRANRPLRRESYSIPKRIEPRFEVISRDQTAWVRLHWKPAAKSAESMRVEAVPLPIEAAVDRYAHLDQLGAHSDAK